MVKIKIGGDDGISTYTLLKGQSANRAVKGWEMKVDIDDNGVVSGSNKNEGSKAKKTYSGTYLNNQLDVRVTVDDGRVITYKGTFPLVNGTLVKLDFVMENGGGALALRIVLGEPEVLVDSPKQKKNKNINNTTRMVKIKIGGDEGTSTYTVFRGVPANTTVKGWEMKIEVDDQGVVTGSNKNEGASAKKTYGFVP
ncbi:hypothetical protein C9374_001803 [Naegleria lovaniensis]|uniref:Uncharacterized protein n=1 Tax=Naegleria lovaniensis TaxID=51637 RepID=A0AA88GWZ7_NAELO|nr:uncharacterized protein C9374_001803 [Naegleria lovaniensis]KAG2387471.1 hypothetical protein C9374_001803 [Naegleria lovaniensis]